MNIQTKLPVLIICSCLSIITGCAEKVTLLPNSDNSAQQLISQAKFLPSPEREKAQIEAVELLIKQRKAPQAEVLLQQINAGNLTTTVYNAHLLAKAHLALATKKPQETLLALSSIQQSDVLTDEAKLDILLSRANAFEQLGYLFDAATVRMQLSTLFPLDEEKSLSLNRHKIWLLLHELPTATLKQHQQTLQEQLTSKQTEMPAIEERLNTDLYQIQLGWIELVLIIKETEEEPMATSAQLQRWQETYNQHPGHALLASPPQSHTLFTVSKENAPPRVIALLLPLTGSLSESGKAIRDGFISAYYADNNKALIQAPTLRIYDTHGDEQVVKAYREAVEAGAHLVIGPLSKNGLERLAKKNLSTPVLALNRLPESSHSSARLIRFNKLTNPNLYQLALAPEDEIKQVTQKAWDMGYLNALILSPDSNWGERLAERFQQEWQAKGGQLLSIQRYPDAGNVADAVKTALNIPDSQSRANQLKRLLGRSFDFELRRRQDIDVIFLAASAEQASQVKPMLAFYFAGSLPVYATSSVYSGQQNDLQTKDIEGTTFCDAPWLIDQQYQNHPLSQAIKQLWPDKQAYSRLYGLGVDAYQILPFIPRLQRLEQLVYKGASGHLSLTENQIFLRQLPCATVQRGSLKLLNSQIATRD